ncbi:MAG: 3-oxoacyl-ACP reductase FabG [Saprospiraceae bacterium]|nr:3-oxoacyl-ACP reductase FabG [Candidatus Vicinibacter affinis]
MKLLEGKTAVITGGAAGIGKAASIKFLEEGANVAVWDFDETKAKAWMENHPAYNSSLIFCKVDTSNAEMVENAKNETMAKFGNIEILLNNAGITRDSTLLKMSFEQWQQVINVNLTGVYNCARIIAPIMAKKGYGRIISAASVVALYGNFGQTNYAAAKAGVVGMTKTWAKELGKKGITANAIAPGFIMTEMVAGMPEERIQAVREKVPVARLGKVEEVADLYAFLASDKAAYINGATISIDGGVML